MKYINADRLKAEIRHLKIDVYDEAHQFDLGARNSLSSLESFIDSLTQEQPNKESLNESQQEFVNIVTERMLKEGPIPTLKGKQKAEFEKEFNRFKQIAGMVNWPAYEEIYKKIILWFMAWSTDNLPNLNKVTDSDELDFQQELPEVDLKKEIKEWVDLMVGASFPEQDGDYISEEDYRSVIRQTALHFYERGQLEMRYRITNPEYNAKVVEQLKSEYPARKED